MFGKSQSACICPYYCVLCVCVDGGANQMSAFDSISTFNGVFHQDATRCCVVSSRMEKVKWRNRFGRSFVLYFVLNEGYSRSAFRLTMRFHVICTGKSNLMENHFTVVVVWEGAKGRLTSSHCLLYLFVFSFSLQQKTKTTKLFCFKWFLLHFLFCIFRYLVRKTLKSERNKWNVILILFISYLSLLRQLENIFILN